GLTVGSGIKVTNTSSNPTLYLEDESGDSTPFVIDASGNVGIGTMGPNYALDVRKSVSSGFSVGTGGDAGRIWTEYKNAGPGIIMYDYDDVGGGIYFRESPTTDDENNPEYEAFIVGKRGNVGIGTTAPNQKLEVNGTAQATTFYASNGISTYDTSVAANTIETGTLCLGNGTNCRSTWPGDIFGGDGSDGPLNVTADTTIDLGGKAYFEKNYTSINISSGATLSFTNPNDNGTIIVLKSQGDVNIGGTINVNGLGGKGGNGAGTNCYSGGGKTTAGAGGGYFGSGAIAPSAGCQSSHNEYVGGPGGGNKTKGSLGSWGGDCGYNSLADRGAGGSALLPLGVGLNIPLPGGGGAGGALATQCGPGSSCVHKDDASGGGRGGGALKIECGGVLTFTGSIFANGQNGEDIAGDTQYNAAGGGGAGGSVWIQYKTLNTNTGTVEVNGGAGGQITTGGGANGGNGAPGQFLIEKYE
ncbi:hypothetical protein J7K44_01120, partial [bacterium]|nr:hypothetical protein [bacterium]